MLLKTLNGDYQPDEGRCLIDGAQAHFKNPNEAIDAGIGVIYRERQILPELTMAESIYFGRMPTKFGFIDIHRVNQMPKRIIDDFELPISPSEKVHDLFIVYQQMVEIMKSYGRKELKVICFDEPTAAIFKDGCYVTTLDAKTASEQEMIRLMAGRDLGDIYDSLNADVLHAADHHVSPAKQPEELLANEGSISTPCTLSSTAMPPACPIPAISAKAKALLTRARLPGKPW